MKNKDPGYRYPDPIDPGEYACFRVYVPKHTLYLGAFWRAYEYFTTWIAWARDPLHTGLRVAEIWRSGFQRARDEYERTNGECIMAITDIRQDPLNPCNIQVQIDDGETWIDKLDMSGCGGGGGGGSSCPVLRFDGTQIQCYDPCTKSWTYIGEPSDPGKQQNPPGKYIDHDCGNGIAASNIARLVEDGKNKMCATLEQGASFADVALSVFYAVMQYLGFAAVFQQAITYLLAGWQYLSVHYGEVAAIDLYEGLNPILPAYFEDDGSITQANYDAMLKRVDGLSAGQNFLSAEGSAYGYAYSWLKAAGPAGIIKLSDAANIATYDCGSAEWETEQDVTLTDGGWAPSGESGLRFGKWESGIGWKSTEADLDQGRYMALGLTRVFPVTTITHVEVSGTLDDSPTHPYPGGPNFNIVDVTNNETLTLITGEQLDTHTWEWNGSATTQQIRLGWNAGEAPVGVSPVGGEAICIHILMRGTGQKPF